MMPVEWPLAASAADRPTDPARPSAGRDRLGIVMSDFFLDESGRLTDEERALMAALLRGLVTDIADELIAALPPLMAAQAESGKDLAYRRLRRAELLERRGLVALLLRRADEQQLAGYRERGGEVLVASLVSDDDAPVAEAAMALTLARGRRRDRFGRLGLEYDDLEAEDAVALTHSVAAALREGLEREADLPLGEASRSLLSRHDEGRRLEASVAVLARALEAAGRAGDDMITAVAQDGDAVLLVNLLARRAGIDGIDAWNFFTGGDAMLLARLAGCGRPAAAQILAAFDSITGPGAAERFIDTFDAIDEERVERCRRWMRLDPHYRNARYALEQANG
jgi:hypothetical protein